MIKAIKNIFLYSLRCKFYREEKMKWKSLSTPCILYPCLHSSSIQLQFFSFSLLCVCVCLCGRKVGRQTQCTRPQYVNRASPADYSSLFVFFLHVFVVDSIRWFPIYLSLFIDFYCYSMMKIACSRNDVLLTIHRALFSLFRLDFLIRLLNFSLFPQPNPFWWQNSHRHPLLVGVFDFFVCSLYCTFRIYCCCHGIAMTFFQFRCRCSLMSSSIAVAMGNVISI